MPSHDLDIAICRLRCEIAAARVLHAARVLSLRLKANPYWHLQPRVPSGSPDSGQWMPSGPLAPASALPVILRRIAFELLREVGRRVAPQLRRIPKLWDKLDHLLTDDDFPEIERRTGPATARRPGHPAMRFRNEDELRRFLGPAGPGREWHHIVEKRLAGKFPPELIHSTDNVINLPVDVHREISSWMSGKDKSMHHLVRRFYVERWTFQDQYNYGINQILQSAQRLGYDLTSL